MYYLCRWIESESDELFDIEINKLNTYIQTHGAKQIGPLIQATSFEIKMTEL